MNNEITNNELVEEVSENVKGRAFKKSAIAIGTVGAIAGLGYAIFKFGKKLADKVKAKKKQRVQNEEYDKWLKETGLDDEITDKLTENN